MNAGRGKKIINNFEKYKIKNLTRGRCSIPKVGSKSAMRKNVRMIVSRSLSKISKISDLIETVAKAVFEVAEPKSIAKI